MPEYSQEWKRGYAVSQLTKTNSMDPLRMPYRKVRSRLKKPLKDDYASEALVTALFTAERRLRRTLVQL